MDNRRWNTILGNFALISAGISACLRAVLIENILPLLLEDSDDSDSSSDSDEEVERCAEPKGSYAETVVALQNDMQFREDFRLTRATFTILHQKLLPCLNNPNLHPVFGGRPTLPTEKTLLIALWVFATPESYRLIYI
jgi:hypothetical protein